MEYLTTLATDYSILDHGSDPGVFSEIYATAGLDPQFQQQVALGKIIISYMFRCDRDTAHLPFDFKIASTVGYTCMFKGPVQI